MPYRETIGRRSCRAGHDSNQIALVKKLRNPETPVYQTHPACTNNWQYPMSSIAIRRCTDWQAPRTSVYELLRRICNAFKLADTLQRHETNVSCGTVWTEAGWCNRQRPLLDALRTGDLASINDAMETFFSSGSAYGFALGADEYLSITACAAREERYIQEWLNRLQAVAVCMGVENARNPERELGDERSSAVPDAGDLLQRIEATTGVAVDFPPVMGCFGCSVAGAARPIPYQALSYYFVAANCINLTGRGRRRFVEFGSGFGGVAYYLAKHGLHRYTSYDLPFACAVQAYFLGNTLGSDFIRLYGEEETALSKIELLPVSDLATSPAPPHDLLIAQDSLVEVDSRQAALILKQLLTSNEWGFVSIAPDFSGSTSDWDGTRVREILPDINVYRLALRLPFALRAGHMFEMYLRDQ